MIMHRPAKAGIKREKTGMYQSHNAKVAHGTEIDT
jgi:hypothetical protein